MTWALVKSGNVVTAYSNPTAVKIDDVQYPENIFTLWSKEELKNIGIYEFIEIDANPDYRFYWQGLSTTVIDDVEGTVTRTYTKTEKNLEDTTDENGVVTKGLKSNAKKSVKERAGSLLQSSDWYVIRATENGATIPESVSQYRADIRAKSNQMETAIDSANTMEAFIALHETILNSFPDVPDALKP